MKLALGVVEVQYEKDGPTTYDVAVWLENRYTIMEYFFMEHRHQIAALVAQDMAMQLETLMAGAPPNQHLVAESMDTIQEWFVSFLDRQDLDGLPGVPTKRALAGISKRYKDVMKKTKNPGPRPSFIDTGSYEASFRAWVEGYSNGDDW